MVSDVGGGTLVPRKMPVTLLEVPKLFCCVAVLWCFCNLGIHAVLSGLSFVSSCHSYWIDVLSLLFSAAELWGLCIVTVTVMHSALASFWHT